MFTSKFVSLLLGLWFINQSIFSIYGAKIVTTCTGTESSLSQCQGAVEPDSLCIKDNVIISYYYNEGTDSCLKNRIDLTPGVNVVEINGKVVTDHTSSLDGSPTITAAKLAIYLCNSVTCTETYGYLFINSKYYSVSSVESAEVESPNGTGIGEMNSSHKIKLDGTNEEGFSVDDSVNNYLLKGNAAAGNVFGASESNARMIIEVRKHSIVLNNLYKESVISCGTISATSCGLGSLLTYCIKTEGAVKTLYEQKANTCTKLTATSGSYVVLKQKGATSTDDEDITFTKELGTETTDKHVVFLVGSNNSVTQQENISILDSNKIVDCDENGECKVKTGEGMFYVKNKNKIYTLDGEEYSDPKEESFIGVFYLKENIYRCRSSGCEKVTINTGTSNGNLNYASGKIQIYNGDWVDVTNGEANPIYDYVDAPIANLIIGDNNKILMKISATYAIKVEPKQGYYLNNKGANNKLIYCSKDGIANCSDSEVYTVGGYYYIGGSGASPKSYIQCTGTTCSEVKFATYDTCGNNNNIENCRATIDPNNVCNEGALEGEVCYHFTTKKLYESGKGKCFEVLDKTEANFQYFNTKHKKVLPESALTPDPIIYRCDVLSTLPTCSNAGESSQCSDGTNTVNYCVSGEYLYKSITSPTNKCERITKKEGELFNCVKNANTLPDCIEDADSTKPCVPGAVEDSFCTTGTALRQTTADGCKAFTHATKTYYFDKEFKMIKKIDSTSSIYTRYACESGSNCSPTSDSAVGKLTRTPTSVEMCLADKESISLLGPTQHYIGITIDESGDFAGTTGTGTMKVKTTGKSIVKVDTTGSSVKSCKAAISTSDEKCNDGDGDVELCITAGNVIYKQETINCQILKGSTAKSTTINYFNAAYKTPSSTDGLEHRYAYRCKFDSGADNKEASECIPVTGYSISSTNLVTCSGFKDDDCEVTALTSALNTCANTEDGKIGKDGSKKVICVDGRSMMTLPSSVTESPSYVAYKSTTGNMIYDVGSGHYNLLEVGPNYAMKAKYIKVTGVGETVDLYFINSADPEISGRSYSIPVIKCQVIVSTGAVDTCVAVEAGGTTEDNPVKYFIDGSTYPTVKSLIQCTYNDGCKLVDAVKSNSAATDHFYYVHGGDNGIIDCTVGGTPTCVTIAYNHASANGYYIDGYDDKSVITCNSGCSSEKFVGIAANGSTRTGEVFIQCNGSSACTYIASLPSNNAFQARDGNASFDTKNSGSFAEITSGGYQLVSAEDAKALINSNTGVIVKVTASSIKKVNIAAGYYPVIDVTATLTKALIHCTGTSYNNCAKEDAKPGYYTFPDSNEKVIKCTSSSCTPEPYVDNKLLPICEKTGPLFDQFCSGPNLIRYCIGTDGVIYESSDSSVATCTPLLGAAKGIQYFAFKNDLTRLGNNGVISATNAPNVYSTYKCYVDDKLAISKCTLVGNQLPTCFEGASVGTKCWSEVAEDNKFCITKDGNLMKSDGGSGANCVAESGTAKSIHYFKDDFTEITPTTSTLLGQVSFIYYCAGGGAALTDCIPIHSNVGAVIKAVKGAVPMMRVSAFDSENVKIGEASALYLTLPAYNSFPGSNFESVSIEVSTSNKIVVAPTKTTSILPSCSNTGDSANKCKNKSDGEVVSYCYDSTFIYESKSDNKCNKVEDTQGSTQYFFFDENYDKVATPTASPTALKYAYQLKFATAASPTPTAEVKSIKPIEYYQKYDGKAVYCNGIENCVIHAISNCGSNDIGKLGKVNNVDSVCFGSNKGVALPTDESSKIIAFKPTNFNKYYSESGLTFLKLTKDTITVATSGDALKGYYLNEAASGLTNALVYCSADGSSNCNLVDASVGYYISSLGNDNVISCSSTGCKLESVEYASCGYENLLPRCERDGSATEVCFGDGSSSFNDKHCLGSDDRIYKNVISADGNKCEPITLTSESPSVSFDDNVGTKASSLGYTYYTCTVSGESISNCVLERKPLPDCTATVNNESPCFENAESGAVCITSGKALLKTTDDGKCEALTGSISKLKYFKDNYKEGDVTNAKYTYKCSSNGSGSSLTGCALVHQVAGGVIRSGSGLAMCSSLDDSEVIGIGEVKDYKEVQVSGFPDITTATDIIIKNTGKQAVIQLKGKAGLPTCNSAGSVTESCKAGSDLVQYCIKNSVIYKSESGKCVKLDDYDTRDGFAFFSKYATKANPLSDSVSYAYNCVFGYDGKVTNCSLAQGIIKTSNRVITCNGWKDDECVVTGTVTSVDCSTSEGEGGIKKGEEGICFGSHSEAFPTDGYKYAAFTTAKINPTYGIIGREHVMLKMTPNSALVTSYDGETPIYLIDLTNPSNSDGKKPLIVCDGNDCTSIESGTQDQIKDTEQNTVVVKGIEHTYYIDGAYPYGNQIITCTQSILNEKGEVTTLRSCTSGSPDDVSYYVDSANDGNVISCGIMGRPLGYGNYPICSDVPTGTYACKVNGSPIVGKGIYCVKEGILYESDSSPVAKCNAVKTCISVTSPFGLYATGSVADNEKLIICDGEDGITCHYVKNVESESNCVDTTDPTLPANEGVIYIDGVTAGFMQCREGKGEALNRSQQGYMLLDVATASKFLQGVTEPILIESNGASYMVASAIQDGYYYNIGFDMLYKSVIRCTENSGCEAIDMDDIQCPGNHNKLPTCTNIESDKACREYGETETSMEHCIYNGKIYKNVSEDEVKCREIQALETCDSVDENAKCIEDAEANSLCLHEGSMYINLENGCKAVNTLATCESTSSGDKCASDAANNDLCRVGNDVYKTSISGSSSSCGMVTTLIDEVGRIPLYFNDETAALTTTSSTSNVDSMYVCSNKYGVLSSCEKSVQSIGGLIFKRAGAEKMVHICINGSVVENDSSSAITSSMGYQAILTEKSDAFPGTTNPGMTVVNFAKNKALLVRDQETLPECDAVSNGSSCKSEGVPVAQCIMNEVLYLSNGNTCTKQTGPSNGYDFTYFDPSSTIIDPVDVKPTKSVAFVYKCEYNSSGVAERCYMVRGYVVVNNYIINCNGWSFCSFAGVNQLDTVCSYAKEGEMRGDGKALCIDDEGNIVRLPTTAGAATRYIMYKAGETSVYYGQVKDSVVVLALTQDSATVVPFGKGITRGYHQNQKTVGSTELNEALIYCTEEGVLASCEVVNGRNGYYLNADDDAAVSAVIKCEEDVGCRKQSVDKTSCTESGAIIKTGAKIQMCKKVGGSFTKIDISQSNTSITYDYISEIDASFPGTVEENKPFVKIGMDGSVVLMDNGIYINEGVRGKTDNALFDCTTLNVDTVCEPTDALFGYYRNAGTVGLDDAFISCSLNGCEVMSVDENAVCDVNSVGQLVGSVDTPTLCLDYDSVMDEEIKVEMDMDSDSAENYMVGYYANNIFGLQEGNYAYVNVSQNYVKFKSSDYVKYVYTENQYKEITECKADSDPETMNEFKFEDYGIYSLNCDGEDKDNLCTKNNA